MLIYAVSLALQFPPCVNILNLCPNTNLVSPVYFGNGMMCPKLTNQQIDINAKMNASFEIITTRDDFEGALLYRLKRYSNWYNMDTSTTGTNKATYVHMLVACKVKYSMFYVYVALIEHAREFTWNENELRKLYYENCWRLKEYNGTLSDIWLVDDDVTLKMSFEVKNLKGNFELSISISEEERDDYAMRPLCVNLER
jgi:hypothetical protein